LNEFSVCDESLVTITKLKLRLSAYESISPTDSGPMLSRSKTPPSAHAHVTRPPAHKRTRV
jgi:hypothetical protein